MADFGSSDPFSANFMLSDWQRKVEAEVRRVLSTPSVLPREFLGFIGPYVEQQAIQVPYSQIVGQFLVVDHVNELGGNVHGRPGVVRVGSGPYNFIGLTFDRVSGKWISDPIPVLTQRSAVDATSSTVYVDSAEATAPLLSWREWDDAGLTFVVRYDVAIRTTNASHTAYTTLQFTPYATNSTAGTPVDSTTHDPSITGTTNFIMKSSGWQSLPQALVLNDYVLIEARLAISDAASQCQITGATAWMRWVSK